jgi:trans-2,3-dihydro-3-hydroxyanthranilate isomerase
MQDITREMNFSECTFVLPREQPATDLRVRIFTPGKEMPMAGHPTIGTAFALARLGIIASRQPSVVFGLGVGPTRVDLDWEGDRLAFAWMTQLLPTFGMRVEERADMAACLGLAEADLLGGLPIEAVSCGVPFLFVPLAERRAVDAVTLDSARLARLYGRIGIDSDVGVFVFSPVRARTVGVTSTDQVAALADEAFHGDAGATAYSRMFAPGLGVAEDPATGAASGPLGCYLVRHRLVTPERAGRIVSLQGVKMLRPSRVHIEISLEADTITRVRVGGRAVHVGEGTVECGP